MKRYRDDYGDVWTEESDGTLSLTDHPSSDSYQRRARVDVERLWGPLKSLDPAPTDLSAPATRGDIVRVLIALSHMANSEGNTYTAKEIAGYADEIKGDA